MNMYFLRKKGLCMITLIDNSLVILAYILAPISLISLMYILFKRLPLKKTHVFITLFLVLFSIFFMMESKSNQPIINNSVPIKDVQGLTNEEIVEKLLRNEFNAYLQENFFAENKVLDYKIERINGPLTIHTNNQEFDDYYDISYSVKVINANWIAGNGTQDGLWIKNKNGYYRLIKSADKYSLKFIGGL